MNLLIDHIDCLFNKIIIELGNSIEDSVEAFQLSDEYRLGLCVKKASIFRLFDTKIIIENNRIEFTISEEMTDYLKEEDLSYAQLYLTCENEYNTDENESEKVFFLSDEEHLNNYLSDINSNYSLYISKTGLLSIRKYKQQDNRSKKTVVSHCDYRYCDGTVFVDDLPEVFLLQKYIRVVFLRMTRAMQVYHSEDFYENCFVSFSLKISNGTVEIPIRNILSGYTLNEDIWFSLSLELDVDDTIYRIILVDSELQINERECYDLRSGNHIHEIKKFIDDNTILFYQSNMGLTIYLHKGELYKNFMFTCQLIDAIYSDSSFEMRFKSNNLIDDIKCIAIGNDLQGYEMYSCYIYDDVLSCTVSYDDLPYVSCDSLLDVYAVMNNGDNDFLVPAVSLNRSVSDKEFVIDEISYKICVGPVGEVGIKVKAPNPLIASNVILRNTYENDDIDDLVKKVRGSVSAFISMDDKGFIHIKPFVNLHELYEVKLVFKNETTNQSALIPASVEGYEILASISADYFDALSTKGLFRASLLMQTRAGVHHFSLYGINKKHEINMNLPFDRRDYFFEKVYDSDNDRIIQLFFALNGRLSLRKVRACDYFQGQYAASCDNVSITNGILKYCASSPRVLGGEFTGICIRYRNRLDEDEIIYYFNNAKVNMHFDEKSGTDLAVIEAELDLTRLELGMIYWDFYLLMNYEGVERRIKCFLRDDSIRKNLLCPDNENLYIYNNNSIVYPYHTKSNQIALCHRNYYPEFDTIKFRYQEEEALNEYEKNKNFYDSQNIILICEKFAAAADNGYFIFKYLMENECEKIIDGHIYYIINKKLPDYERIKKWDDHVLQQGSKEHQIALLACRFIVSTDVVEHSYIFRIRESNYLIQALQKKYIFLQHGVTALKKVDNLYGKGKTGEPVRFITTSAFESSLVKKHFHLDDNVIKTTGFARWDALEDKSEGKRKILVCPTWRIWLDDVENDKFINSEYFTRYSSLLRSKKFHDLLETYDSECDFYIHIKFKNYISNFLNDIEDVSKRIHIKVFGEQPLNEMIMECKLLITDYSSVTWDVFYQKKPVLFYQFDIDDYLYAHGSYIDMRKNLPGERAEEQDELLDYLQDYLKNDFAIKPRFRQQWNGYFDLVDDKNCERIWKVIKEYFEEINNIEPYMPCEIKSVDMNTIDSTIHPYVIATRNGNVGLKTIIRMIFAWMAYKLHKK